MKLEMEPMWVICYLSEKHYAEIHALTDRFFDSYSHWSILGSTNGRPKEGYSDGWHEGYPTPAAILENRILQPLRRSQD